MNLKYIEINFLISILWFDFYDTIRYGSRYVGHSQGVTS